MIFDSHGLPRDSGATDFADSARLAGIMMVFDHPEMNGLKLAQYIVNGDQGVRYPYVDPTGNLSSNNPKNFTRDQLMCLSAGLAVAGRKDLCLLLLKAAEERNCRAQNVEKDVIGSVKTGADGADLLSPSHMNHLRICAGVKPKLLGKLFLVADICWNSVFARMEEPNQLMCMCKTAGSFYVKLLRTLNSKLDAAITHYWAGWRGEPELAKLMIKGFQ